MDNCYLITGAAGHLGSTLVRGLLEKGCSVRALVLPGEKHIPSGADIYYGDVCDATTLAAFFANPENKSLIVIHAAGIVTIASHYEQRVYDVNVLGTRNIVQLCMEHHVKRLVYISSVHAIAEKPKGETITETQHFDPDAVIGLYAKTKAIATKEVLLAAENGLNACVVHPSGITGPYDYGSGHLTRLIIDYYKHRLTSAIDGGYDFVDVRDVAEAIITCAEKGLSGECYILSNRYFQVKEILDMLHQVTGKKQIKRILPGWFVKLTSHLAELYYKILRQVPLFTPYSLYTLNSNALFSHEKATREFGYSPRDMQQTLSDTVAWLSKIKRI